MKRLIDWHLSAWKTRSNRKPLLLKGARQIGKTYAVRTLGQTFDSFVEVNFEQTPQAKTLFEKDLLPDRLLRELKLLTKKSIIPGKTLLFLDEVQVAPQALLALRYFYEQMPQLHVIAAGSLLDFAIEKVGIPVGRVSMLYVYPLSFLEFLAATDNGQFIEPILHQEPLSPLLHDDLLGLVSDFLAIGGMPEAVLAWAQNKNPSAVYRAQKELVETYRQDFPKYAKATQLQYLDILFGQIPHLIGNQFKYSLIHGEFKKRELAPCLDLLRRANVVHQIHHSASNGVPLGAEVNLERFKTILLDVGISQAFLGLDLPAWFLNFDKDLINRGAIVEAFVGQELLAYNSPLWKTELYFWKRESTGSLAEVDYVHDLQGSVLPIEVKSGHGSTLRSMHQFLLEHTRSKKGIRFYAGNYHADDKLDSLPLYAVSALSHSDQHEALRSLL